jgi:hypothetical protein
MPNGKTKAKSIERKVAQEVRKDVKKYLGSNKPRQKIYRGPPAAGARNGAAVQRDKRDLTQRIMGPGSGDVPGPTPRVRSNVSPKTLQGRRIDQACSAIIESVTLPKEARPLRVGSMYSSPPTGACNPFARIDIGFNTTFNNQVAVVFRSALRASVIQYNISATPSTAVFTSYAATCQLECPLETEVNFAPYALARGTAIPGVTYNDNWNYANALYTHGDYLYPGILHVGDQRRGFWLDVGGQIYLTQATDPTAGSTFTYNFWKSVGNQWELLQTSSDIAGGIGGTVGVLTAPVTLGGYYAISIVCNTFPTTPDRAPIVNFGAVYISGNMKSIVFTMLDALSNSTTLAVVPTTFFAAHAPLPSMNDQFGSVEAVRVFGASIMYTNTGSASTRQGEVTGIQLPSGTDPLANFATLTGMIASFRDVAALKNSKTFDSMEGIYGFLKPTDDRDFAYLNEYISGEGDTDFTGPDNVESCGFLINPISDYLAVIVSTTTQSSQTGYYTFAYAVEYKTEDQWRNVAPPRYTMDQMRPGIAALKDVPQWHRNDFHISDIWDWLKDAATTVVNGIVEYGPMVLKGAAMLAPLLL